MVIFNYNCHVLTEKALTIDFKDIFDVGCSQRLRHLDKRCRNLQNILSIWDSSKIIFVKPFLPLLCYLIIHPNPTVKNFCQYQPDSLLWKMAFKIGQRFTCMVIKDHFLKPFTGHFTNLVTESLPYFLFNIGTLVWIQFPIQQISEQKSEGKKQILYS